MRYKKITELPDFIPLGEQIEAMAVEVNREIRKVNLLDFDYTDLNKAIIVVKESIDKHGHVIIIPYRPI